jgi:hypothetical protein
VIGMKLDTREMDTAFAELICADAQWLREEFDALIASSFGKPPAGPPPAPPRVPPHRRYPGPPCWPQPQADPVPITNPVTAPGHRRQRSPPA